jgi:hypothetical protein
MEVVDIARPRDEELIASAVAAGAESNPALAAQKISVIRAAPIASGHISIG